MISTGDTSSVGLGGLTTGEIVTASADAHPDLFWAIRGGGNFGIVTEFTFRLALVGQIFGGVLMLPATRAVLRGYLEYAATAPDDLTAIANLMHAPPAPFVPVERVGETVLMIIVCWTGDLAEGERALAPLRALTAPVAEAVGPMPYLALYQITAPQAEPHAAAVRMMFANALSDETLDATLAGMERATSPFCIVQFRGLGGAVTRAGREAYPPATYPPPPRRSSGSTTRTTSSASTRTSSPRAESPLSQRTH